jgi:ABC-type transport system, involved in lipoprotein release, permease component
MKISDLVSMCTRNLVRRKFRTFLTVIGVTIGTTAIIVMISLGLGISESQNEWINSMGDLTTIEVYNWGDTEGLVLNDDALQQILQMDGAEVATPFFQSDYSVTLYAGKNQRYMAENQWSVYGVYPEALEKLGYLTQSGVPLAEASTGKTVALVFGSQVPYNFLDTKKRYPNNQLSPWPDETGEIPAPFFDPLNIEMIFEIGNPWDNEISPVEFEVVVVSTVAGSGTNEWEAREGIFLPIDDYKKMLEQFEKENRIKKDRNHVDQYNQVRVKAKTLNDVTPLIAQIEELGFGTWSMESYRQQAQEQAQQLQLILGALGGVSLFVAAISITNTMIMSVYERTREIGVMKVLGCLVQDIRTIFLVEAGMIGMVGGVAGVVVSYLLSFLLNTFGGELSGILGGWSSAGRISVIPPWLVLLGLGFSTLIGLASGFAPANRAVKISALEAIKQD